MSISTPILTKMLHIYSYAFAIGIIGLMPKPVLSDQALAKSRELCDGLLRHNSFRQIEIDYDFAGAFSLERFSSRKAFFTFAYKLHPFLSDQLILNQCQLKEMMCAFLD